MGKPSPKYWWDFKGDDITIIVIQSDYIGGENLAEFPANESGIQAAHELIEDFMAGRKTPSRPKPGYVL